MLAQSRPDVAQSTLNSNAIEKTLISLPLLETHQNHSIKVEGTENNIPLFMLPKGSSPESNTALCKALAEYSESSTKCKFHSTTRQSVANSFSLLATLFGENEAIHGTVDESRRLEALSALMRRIVSNDMMQAISSAQSSGDIYGSIFAALSGGDVSRASSLALDSGNLRLSLMLANTSFQAQPFANSQLEMWQQNGAQAYTPNGILRVFSLTSGKMDVEEQIFKSNRKSYGIDWRRRFGMYIWSCSHAQSNPDISSIMKQYSSDVSAGLAPPPKPCYLDGSNMLYDESKPMNQCIMYQVLNHYASPNIPLSNIIAPSSHTSSHHDYSASFHLSATMSAVSNGTLSTYQEDLVVDSVSSQLISEGYWEWAVYVALCVIGDGAVSESVAYAKRLRAKNIIMKHFSPSSDTSAGKRRAFLEKVGIPSEWFHEAYAYRCANEGHVFGYIENLMRVSVKTTLVALEEHLIPHMILSAPQKLMKLLQVMGSNITEESRDLWNKPYGCGAIHEFLVLHKKVEELSELAPAELSMCGDDIDLLLNTATNLEIMMAEADVLEKFPLTKTPVELKRTPRSVIFAEVAATLSLLRMQLIALQNGQHSVDLNVNSSTSLTCSSQLAFNLSSDGLFGSSSKPICDESILRGICGFNISS